MRISTSLLLSLAWLLAACGPSSDEPGPAQGFTAEQNETAAAPQREPLLHIPIRDKLQEAPDHFKADWSFDLIGPEFLGSDAWSAHVHVIPKDQLVPAHHHPQNDELVWIVSGEAQWLSWTASGGRSAPTELKAGALAIAPATSVHAVRNRDAEPLAALVLHRPSFGQNWYVMEDEVTSEITSGELPSDGSIPEGFLDGWEIGSMSFEDGRHEDPGFAGDILLLVRGGRGQLVFEDKELPLWPGVFVRVPPALPYSVVDAEQADIFTVKIPRPSGA
jgi:mannose-6-phosphate isomerase-like protein (cupin superfamily)